MRREIIDIKDELQSKGEQSIRAKEDQLKHRKGQLKELSSTNEGLIAYASMCEDRLLDKEREIFQENNKYEFIN